MEAEAFRPPGESASPLEMLGEGAMGSHRIVQTAVPLGTRKISLQILDDLSLFFVDMRATLLLRTATAGPIVGEVCLKAETFEEAVVSGDPGEVVVCVPQFVKPRSALQEAGILDGDLITHINGQRVSVDRPEDLFWSLKPIKGVQLLDLAFLRATGESSAEGYPWHEALAFWKSGVRRHILDNGELGPSHQWMRQANDLRARESIRNHRLCREFTTQDGRRHSRCRTYAGLGTRERCCHGSRKAWPIHTRQVSSGGGDASRGGNTDDRSIDRDSGLDKAAAAGGATGRGGGLGITHGDGDRGPWNVEQRRLSCDYCAKKKTKCSGGVGRCLRCRRDDQECVYSPKKRTGPPKRRHVAAVAAGKAQQKSDNRRVATKPFRFTEASLNLPRSGASVVGSGPRNGSGGGAGIGDGGGVAPEKDGGGKESNSSAGEQCGPFPGDVGGDSSKSGVESDGGDGEERESPREERGASDQSAMGSLEGAGKGGGGEGEAAASAAAASQGGEDSDTMPLKPSHDSRSSSGGSGYNSNSSDGGGADGLAKISTRTRNKTAAKAAAVAAAARAAEEATAATPKNDVPPTLSPLPPSADLPLPAGKGADDGDSGTGTNRMTAASGAAGEARPGQVSSLDDAPIASTPAAGKISKKMSAGSCVVKSEPGENIASRSEGSSSRGDATFEIRGWEQQRHRLGAERHRLGATPVHGGGISGGGGDGGTTSIAGAAADAS
ncbi:conserved unknown protein [Ectocarpus siliculosus]|uniref:Zn(2)-C6 fungal-type domain-containing protein n=1 Tax=Ectocarpus siliculosus TaxID=2880 RepID=D7G9B3_ECTSI|nr:conserved unknown protein [Ectocarpus siliculosus]|eukprot:CBJ28256.1 conserved unknown protein [Ectocarpus siliculosus]